ncbi:MAG: GNAT family N-acetyltransferase [Bacteroidales bacterium]|nr:GNAT family N-acetyltransferase [Bacteroidales bacterium]MBP3254797.1 GNAT family N-acetyltransferase [Bacteroidales bacterium]
MSDIIIKEIPYNKGKYRCTSSKEFNDFLDFPFKLFKHDKMFVPPLYTDERNTFNKKINPALEWCEYKIFLAYKNGELAGRIAGIINNKANEIWKRKYIRFGWFDTVDDSAVAKALLDAVIEWGRSRGLNRIVGPMGFTDMDKEGMMVEGFDTLCPMASLYNPAYYPVIMEKLGFVKEVDWVQYEIPASQPVPEKMSRINNRIKDKYNLKIVEGLSKNEMAKRYGRKIFVALNKAFEGLYGYVPLTDGMIDYYVKQYLPFLNKDLICLVVDEHDDVVAFGISMPTLSKALQKSKGKLLPFGWVHLLKALKNYECIDLYLNGVDPQWQNKGIHSIYYAKMNENYIRLGSKTAIANPQLETNQAANIWTKYDSKIAIRRRAYIKEI